MRFQRLDTLDDLEATLAAHSQAVALTPDEHPDKPARLCTFGDSQSERGTRLMTPDDLDASVTTLRRAVTLAPDGDIRKLASLNNLGIVLNTRFLIHRDQKDLEAAIAIMTEVVMLTPDGHPSKPLRLANLGTVQHILFERSQSPVDLKAALESKAQAVELLSDDDSDQPKILNNLGISLLARFKQAGELNYWKMAAGAYMRALELAPQGHTMRAKLLEHLGKTFIAKTYTPHGIFGDLLSAIHYYGTSLLEKSGDPATKMRSGTALIRLLADPLPPQHFEPFAIIFAGRLLEVYQDVLNLIPQVIWLGYNVKRRYEEVVRLGTLSNQAAAAAIAAGQYAKAIEWLECGRSIVRSQVLQLRTPLEALRRRHPQLATRLERISTALQTDDFPIADEPQPSISLNSQAKSHYSLAIEYNKLLEEIRSLDGFHDFLLPVPFSKLKEASTSTHVVIVNVCESRCDALILHHCGEVAHVPLVEFSFHEAQKLQARLRDVLRNERLLGRFRDQLDSFDDHPGRGGRTRDPGNHSAMRVILASLWKGIVEPVLDAIAELPNTTSVASSNGGTLSRVTWCPTGPLVFLPLHAAGIYTDRGPVSTVMDRVVSSYTPTLEMLVRDRIPPSTKPGCRASTEGTTSRILIVSQPDTPGQSPIPNTEQEAELIQSLFPLSTKILTGSDAVVDTVLENMGTHGWIHLACHGSQNSQDATQSQFALHDGPLKLSMLMNKGLPNAELAVLSACQTATGDERLSEEAVHLAAAMLNVGYKSIVGTMWSISDYTAPKIAKGLYESLRRQVDAKEELQPAYALHEAVRNLYSTEDLFRWIPFVHTVYD